VSAQATLVSSSNSIASHHPWVFGLVVDPISGVRSAGSACAARRLLGKDGREIGMGVVTALPGRMLVIAGKIT
jgi:hypothetical protein